MSTPPMPPGSGQPPNPNDPRNHPYGDPRFQQQPAPDPRWQREQQKAWQRAQREQQKAWREQQRQGFRNQARSMRQQARINAEAQRAQLRSFRRVHRANSLVGPLLLIAFAVVVLLVYSGHLSAPGTLGWFGRWWPLILIAAGLVRIAEWGIARATAADPDSPLRFSVGGGTVFLLILVAVAGFSAQGFVQAAEHGFTINSPFFDTNSDAFRQFFGSKREEDAPAITRSIAPEATLQIDNGHGDVTVNGTSDDGLLHVSVHKEVFAGSDNRAAQLLADLQPQFSGSDGQLSLRIPGTDNGSATLTVLVPRTVHVVLNTNRGDVHVGSFHAPVVVNANRGDVEVASVAGDVRVRMNARHGELTVRSVQGAVLIAGSGDELNLNDIAGPVNVSGDFFDSGHLQHVTGNVAYEAGRIGFTAARIDGEVSFDSHDEFSASGLTGPVNIKTRSRDVTLSRISGDVHVSNSSGHVELVSVPPSGSINIDNRDGDVSLSLPSNAHFSINAETSDGSITSDFPGIGSNVSQSPRGTLTGSVGTNGNSIHLTTTHGNITLAKNEEGPIPPVAPVPPVAPAPPAAPVSGNANDFRDAQKAIRNAQTDARRAVLQGLAEARQATKDAKRQADQARKDARREADQARKDAQE